MIQCGGVVVLILSFLYILLDCTTFAVDDVHSDPHKFCYVDKTCSPESSVWAPDVCHSGITQSPIDLHANSGDHDVQVVDQPLHRFSADHFFMQNNGHTINIDFPIQHETGDTYFFPGYGFTKTKYRLANAHFHWGNSDTEGSEHTINGKSYAMEMHLVHYNEKYGSAKKAMASGDKDALSVIGVLFDATTENVPPNSALAPIIKGLKYVQYMHSYWVKIDEPIDMMSLLPSRGDNVFHYKGSLTTPPCSELVNWYVFQTPIPISSDDIKEFRTVVDGGNHTLKENHRPIQKLFQREIKMLRVH